MAVSMSAGFMRSDYMISDAALPLRIEEMEQLEQSAKFSEILSGIGDAPVKEVSQAPAKETMDAPAEAVTNAPAGDADITADSVTLSSKPEQPIVLSKAELKALARAVVRGEIKLSEIPEEFKTDILLLVIAMMMLGIPENEIPALQEAPEGEPLVTVTAEVVERVTAKLEITSDKTSELNELLTNLFAGIEEETVAEQFVVPETEEAQLVQAIQPTQAETAEQTAQTVESVQPVLTPEVRTETAEAGTAEAAEYLTDTKEMPQEAVKLTEDGEIRAAVMADAADEAAVQPTDSESREDMAEIKPVGIETAAKVTSENVQSVVTRGGSTQHNDGFGESVMAQMARRTQTASAEQTDTEAEFAELKKMISEVTVKTNEPKQQNTEMFAASRQLHTEAAAKGRMVIKSDELAMLKNAAKPAAIGADIEANAVPDVSIKTNTDSGAQNETNLGAQFAAPMAEAQSTASDMPVVFVRRDGTEVSVKPSEVIEQVTANVVEQAAKADGSTEYSVTLTPEDLGTITVKLTKAADGALTVSIAADNARTMRILEESGLALQNSLKQNGIELEAWQTVNESRQETRAQDYSGSGRNPYYREESSSDNGDAEDNSFAELISAM